MIIDHNHNYYDSIPHLKTVLGIVQQKHTISEPYRNMRIKKTVHRGVIAKYVGVKCRKR